MSGYQSYPDMRKENSTLWFGGSTKSAALLLLLGAGGRIRPLSAALGAVFITIALDVASLLLRIFRHFRSPFYQ
jgi:hypothetical protein